jgi:hypothetical protein
LLLAQWAVVFDPRSICMTGGSSAAWTPKCSWKWQLLMVALLFTHSGFHSHPRWKAEMLLIVCFSDEETQAQWKGWG